jgi:hypothetical protein
VVPQSRLRRKKVDHSALNTIFDHRALARVILGVLKKEKKVRLAALSRPLEMAYDRSPSPLASNDSLDICYFSLAVQPSGFHYSDETPLSTPSLDRLTQADPSHPLLARREPSPIPSTPLLTMDASKLLQLQTAAAYSAQLSRPPTTHFNSDSSSASVSSRSSSAGAAEHIRCVRCQRTSSHVSDPAKAGMVAFGTNLFYCVRCAQIVGYLT